MKRKLAALALAVGIVAGTGGALSAPTPASAAVSLPGSRSFSRNGCTVAYGYFSAYTGFAQQMSASGSCKRIRLNVMNYTCSIVSLTAQRTNPAAYSMLYAGISVPIYYLWVEMVDKYGVITDRVLTVTGVVQ